MNDYLLWAQACVAMLCFIEISRISQKSKKPWRDDNFLLIYRWKLLGQIYIFTTWVATDGVDWMHLEKTHWNLIQLKSLKTKQGLSEVTIGLNGLQSGSKQCLIVLWQIMSSYIAVF